ncbi:MAG: hypothetical protein ACAI44_14625 [Candidatus Sericytochromatia bacterium]
MLTILFNSHLFYFFHFFPLNFFHDILLPKLRPFLTGPVSLRLPADPHHTARTVQGQPRIIIGNRPPEIEEPFRDDTEHPPMPLSARARSFKFKGPVTVMIGALDEDNKIIKAAVDVNLRDAFVKVTLNPVEIPTLGLNLTHPQNVLRTGKAETISFPIFFAMYDAPTAAPNGIVDYLSRQGITPGGPDDPFLARSNDDLEPTNVNVPGFGFQQGIYFPKLSADYLLNHPMAFDASQVTPELDENDPLYRDENDVRFTRLGRAYERSDMLLLAAKLSYSGQTLQSKEGIAVTGNLNFEPIFYEIDFRSELAGNIHVVDMHLGNMPQGFVASAYYGQAAFRWMATDIRTLPKESYDNSNGFTEALRGTVNAPIAKLGSNASGQTRHMDVVSVEWQNVPLFSDEDLSGANVIIR